MQFSRWSATRTSPHKECTTVTQHSAQTEQRLSARGVDFSSVQTRNEFFAACEKSKIICKLETSKSIFTSFDKLMSNFDSFWQFQFDLWHRKHDSCSCCVDRWWSPQAYVDHSLLYSQCWIYLFTRVHFLTSHAGYRVANFIIREEAIKVKIWFTLRHDDDRSAILKRQQQMSCSLRSREKARE